MSKEERTYRREMKRLLLEDLSRRRAEIGDNSNWGNCFNMPEPQSLKSSLCQKKEFEIFELGKNMGTLVNSVTAVYCPREKRYWMSQCVGDVALRGRWSGPFDFEGATAGMPKRISLTEAGKRFPLEYQDVIAKTADWFVKDTRASEWFVTVQKKNDSQIDIQMSHISGIK